MSTALNFARGAVATCTMSLLLYSCLAHSQEAPSRILTIADCPPGYILGVQSTDSLMPLNRGDMVQGNPYTAYQQAQGQADTAYATAQATAPRAFVTGCIPPQPVQPQ